MQLVKFAEVCHRDVNDWATKLVKFCFSIECHVKEVNEKSNQRIKDNIQIQWKDNNKSYPACNKLKTKNTMQFMKIQFPYYNI